MSRYTGPRVKILRRFGISLPGLTRKTVDENVTPPGEHGANHRRKASEYREHLDEKQKLRLNYGLSERQFVIYMKSAISSKLDTGLRLIQLLEGRLDNFVFRAISKSDTLYCAIKFDVFSYLFLIIIAHIFIIRPFS